MNPIDPLRPLSLDELLAPVDSRPGYGSYGPASLYQPYEWEMPRMETPLPAVPPPDELLPEPPRPPRYEDCLLTPELFARHLQDLRG